ncbi:MAG: hypothetical protein SGJ10_08310 [Bacteroidota bacterium]|nr:hypothetical protein [Bacteroidota bacterium]
MKKVLYLLPFLFFGCKKKEAVSNVPVITFVNAAPSTVKAYKDSVVFTIGYADADGDLGENSVNAENLFLTDNRINITYKYRIKQLAPTGAVIAIKGNLDVILKSTDITDSTSATQTATYNIYVTDRAGNKSNVITSSAITINK